MAKKRTDDVLAELLDTIDEWRGGSPTRDFTPLLSSLPDSQLREINEALGFDIPKGATRSRLLHDAVGRINGLAVGEEEYASTTRLRNAADRRPRALPAGRVERGIVRRETGLARRGVGEGGLMRMGKEGVRVGTGSPVISPGRPRRRVESRVVGALPAGRGAGAEAAGKAGTKGGLGKLLGKIPGPVKKVAGPLAVGLLVADILSRGEDATFGREARNREAEVMDTMDTLAGLQLGREEVLTDLQGLGLAREEAIGRELGATQTAAEPARRAAALQNIVLQNRARIMEAAQPSEPSDEEFALALRLMGAGR